MPIIFNYKETLPVVKPGYFHLGHLTNFCENQKSF